MEKFLVWALFAVIGLVFLGLAHGLGSVLAGLATCVTDAAKRGKR